MIILWSFMSKKLFTDEITFLCCCHFAPRHHQCLAGHLSTGQLGSVDSGRWFPGRLGSRSLDHRSQCPASSWPRGRSAESRACRSWSGSPPCQWSRSCIGCASSCWACASCCTATRRASHSTSCSVRAGLAWCCTCRYSLCWAPSCAAGWFCTCASDRKWGLGSLALGAPMIPAERRDLF